MKLTIEKEFEPYTQDEIKQSKDAMMSAVAFARKYQTSQPNIQTDSLMMHVGRLLATIEWLDDRKHHAPTGSVAHACESPTCKYPSEPCDEGSS